MGTVFSEEHGTTRAVPGLVELLLGVEEKLKEALRLLEPALEQDKRFQSEIDLIRRAERRIKGRRSVEDGDCKDALIAGLEYGVGRPRVNAFFSQAGLYCAALQPEWGSWWKTQKEVKAWLKEMKLRRYIEWGLVADRHEARILYYFFNSQETAAEFKLTWG